MMFLFFPLHRPCRCCRFNEHHPFRPGVRLHYRASPCEYSLYLKSNHPLAEGTWFGMFECMRNNESRMHLRPIDSCIGKSCQYEWMPPVPDTLIKANSLSQALSAILYSSLTVIQVLFTLKVNVG